MSNYRNGADFERETRHQLEAEGYWVTRAAGSKTKVDLIAIKPFQILFIQCKRTGRISPAERVEVQRIAQLVGGIPLLARRELRPSRVVFEQLTGPGPSDRSLWITDELGA